MRYLILLITFTIFGAGCAPESQKVATSLCDTPPVGNDAGRLVYPIAPLYQRLPNLGQIFTALDCGDRERALKIAGFENESYTAGVTLSWNANVPSGELKTVLERLGFNELSPGTWRTSNPLTLEALEELKTRLSDPIKNGDLEYEDCVVCG